MPETHYYWPPKQAQSHTFGAILDATGYNASIRYLRKVFSDLSTRHTIINLYFHRLNMFDGKNKGLPTERLYGDDPELPAHISFVEIVVQSLKLGQKIRQSSSSGAVSLWSDFCIPLEVR